MIKSNDSLRWSISAARRPDCISSRGSANGSPAGNNQGYYNSILVLSSFLLILALGQGTVILTGIGPLATLALSILLLGIASRLAARNPATALLLGVNPARQQFS